LWAHDRLMPETASRHGAFILFYDESSEVLPASSRQESTSQTRAPPAREAAH